MDPTEEIIKEYLEYCKRWFLIPRIQFKVPGNYSDIDFLATDGKGKFYSIEVKWYSRYQYSKSECKELARALTTKRRISAIKARTGKKPHANILIMNDSMLGQRSREEKLKIFRKQGIKVWFFDKILDEMTDKINPKGGYNSIAFQLLHMLSYHEKLAKHI